MKREIVVSILLFCAAWLSLPTGLLGQPKPDIIVFDEDDPVGVGYYDASFGLKSGGSTLAMAGPSNDKLVISMTQHYTGTNSGVLQWKSVSGGSWKIFVASVGWATRDASGYDSLVFFVNSLGAIASTDLPKVGLESSTNISTPAIDIGAYLSTGTDADTTTWQRVSIPLTAFEPYGGFSLSSFKDVNFGQGAADNVDHTMWFDNARLLAKTAAVDTTIPSAPKKPVWRVGDRSVVLHWDRNAETNLMGYNVYRAQSAIGPFVKVTSPALSLQSFADFDVTNGQVYYYYVRAVNTNQIEGPNSDTLSAAPTAFSSDTDFLDYLEHTAFDYFWYEANPKNGLIRDRSETYSASSIAAVGFGLTAIGIGVDRGWITREEGRDRTLTTLKTFWEQPQGPDATGAIGYKGWFYHFLEMGTAVRAGSSELSSIDTGLLLAGILYAKQYFNGSDTSETRIRTLADQIFGRVDWNWMTNGAPSLTMGWNPGPGFIGARWIGYNEAMILNLMGLGAGTNPLPAAVWNSWTGGYRWQTQYGYTFVNFPPLFGHQYSHCWIDFRNVADAYMRAAGITYAENTRRATLAQRAYCMTNPGGFTGYGTNVWGLTACDGPGSAGYFGYIARGAPPPENDDGTIAPTAAGGSIPFAPEVCTPALRYMYDQYRANIWTGYGFRDAFNLKANWWGPDVIGIDQGPIIIMAENYRTGNVWKLFMQSPEIQLGLQAAGFTTVNAVEDNAGVLPAVYSLEQNYPNPFNPVTVVNYALPRRGHVTLKVYNLLAQEVSTLVDDVKDAGRYDVTFDAHALASGVYYYRLNADGEVRVRRMLLLR